MCFSQLCKYGHSGQNFFIYLTIFILINNLKSSSPSGLPPRPLYHAHTYLCRNLRKIGRNKKRLQKWSVVGVMVVVIKCQIINDTPWRRASRFRARWARIVLRSGALARALIPVQGCFKGFDDGFNSGWTSLAQARNHGISVLKTFFVKISLIQ